MASATSWLQLCAALDAIGDTQLAVRAYMEKELQAESDGGNYLVAYGALQALYVQQDAARKIAEVVEVPLELPEAVREIRRVRNAAIGHPAEFRRKKSASIVRATLSSAGFSYYIWEPGGDAELKDANLNGLCSEQTELLGEFLEKVANGLREEELMHRRKYRDQLLSEAFHDHLGHAFEKITEGLAATPGQVSIAGVGIGMVDDALRKFQDGLKERQLEGAYPQSADPALDEARFGLRRLTELRDGSLPELETRDGYAYLAYLRAAVDKLERIAKEIDEEYATDEL